MPDWPVTSLDGDGAEPRAILIPGGSFRMGSDTGRPDEARPELSTAVAMLREMGMAFWLPEAERELAGAFETSQPDG